MAKKIVLVTGATGFVGSNIVRRLVEEKKFAVHILARKISNFWRIRDLLNEVNLHEVALAESTLLKRTIKTIKPEVIFHLANAPLYQGTQSKKSDYINTNFAGTVNLIDACGEVNYKCFVNTGSSAEYGPKNRPMRETDVCLPLSLYAVSKLAGTTYSHYIGKTTSHPIINFRLFSPFGPYDDPKRLIVEIIANALQNKPIFLSIKEAVRDYIYINDVVDAYLAVIERADKYKGGIFNIGSGRETRVKEVVETVLKLTDSKSKIKWGVFSSRSFESPKWQADITKTKRYLRWWPRYSLEKGLKETINWFRKNISLYEGQVREF